MATSVTVGTTRQVPVPAQAMPVVVAETTSPNTIGMPMGSTAKDGGSRRAPCFRIAQQELEL